MEGDDERGGLPQSLDEVNERATEDRALEWVIRLLMLGLTLTAVWTVFGDDLMQLFAR